MNDLVKNMVLEIRNGRIYNLIDTIVNEKESVNFPIKF